MEEKNEMQLADQVRGSENLGELCDNLEALEEALEDNSERSIEDYVDTTRLPTFGGAEPEDTMGVYSWDDTEQLVQGNGGRGEHWNIEERKDLK